MDACLLPSIADICTPPGYDRQKSAKAPATKENAERSAATTPTDFVMADLVFNRLCTLSPEREYRSRARKRRLSPFGHRVVTHH